MNIIIVEHFYAWECYKIENWYYFMAPGIETMLEMIHAKVETLKKKNLVGMSIPMSVNENKTFQLFKTFMPRKKGNSKLHRFKYF